MNPPLLIKANGEHEAITDPLTLATMQHLVGGYIELVTLRRRPGRRIALLVNEEGALRGLPVNRVASLLAKQPIVGDAILCVVLHEGQDNEQYVGLEEDGVTLPTEGP